MDRKFTAEKNTKVFNTVCTQNIRTTEVVDASQLTSLPGKESDSCFATIKFHTICNRSILQTSCPAAETSNHQSTYYGEKFYIISKEKKFTTYAFTAEIVNCILNHCRKTEP
jgi:hypothetical protein